MSDHRLTPVNLVDFTGGLATRRSEFSLAENESPDMLNIEVDPRGGFYTRRGWQRWNATDVVPDPADWHPRAAELHPLITGAYQVYITNIDTIYAAGPDGIFSDLAIPCEASPHLADIATWGNTAYFACGRGVASWSREGTNPPAPLGTAWHDDYTVPGSTPSMPQAEHVEPHAGYLFVANTQEAGTTHLNRIRWSHPDAPTDWGELDYIDIEAGGGEITAIKSFNDHLLIFKTDSMWALYGYDRESWQVIKVSQSVGAPSPTAVTRSEGAVYFFSAADRGGVYAYNGQSPVHLTEKLRDIFEDILTTRYEDVWLGWTGKRLWCSLPWIPDGVASGDETSAFVFDPETGPDGAWVLHQAAVGNITCIIGGSDIEARWPLAVVCGCSGAAAVVQLEYSDLARDYLGEGDITGSAFETYYRTGWKHAGWPERQKSWLRPRFVARRPTQDVVVRASVAEDYDSARVVRTGVATVPAGGDVFLWKTGGFADAGGMDWKELGAADPSGRGADWSLPSDGGLVGRTTQNLGVNRAVQLEIRGDDETLGNAWGIDAIILKYHLRRFTT